MNDNRSCADIRAELAEVRRERDEYRDECEAIAAKFIAGPPWLADAAEALGQVADDGSPFALTWSQVIREIRELRHRFDAEVEHHKLTLADRDKWLDEAKQLRAELDALKANHVTNWRRSVPWLEHLVADAPEPVKAEPFRLVSDGRPIAEYAATPNECAIRDRIQEIESRLARLETSK